MSEVRGIQIKVDGNTIIEFPSIEMMLLHCFQVVPRDGACLEVTLRVSDHHYAKRLEWVERYIDPDDEGEE